MNKTSGNVLIYVLLAIVLFAALSFVLTKQLGKSGSTGRLDDDRAGLRAEELIQYATGVRSTIEQMRSLGNVLPTELSFVKQGETGYATGSNAAKVYHPGGGGLNVFTPGPELFVSTSAKRGWNHQMGTNVDWTSTSASDVIYSFVDVDPAICAAINKRLYKDTAIPVVDKTASALFINGDADDEDFLDADCDDCDGRVSLCVEDSAGVNVFYNLVVSR